jgi:hypothetical protein
MENSLTFKITIQQSLVDFFARYPGIFVVRQGIHLISLPDSRGGERRRRLVEVLLFFHDILLYMLCNLTVHQSCYIVDPLFATGYNTNILDSLWLVRIW